MPVVATTADSTTSLDVSWTAPANNGKPGVRSYDLRYRAGDSGSWTDGPQDVTGTSATLTGLTPNTSYQVQVRATNDEGDGDWFDAGTGATGAPDNSAPEFPDATLTREVAENTLADTDIGAPIPAATDVDGDTLTYSLQGTDAASFAFDAATRQLSTLAALDFESKATYAVTVKADDDNDGSDTIAVTVSVTDVDEPPDAPAMPVVATTADSTTSLDVSWTAPANNGKPGSGATTCATAPATAAPGPTARRT